MKRTIVSISKKARLLNSLTGMRGRTQMVIYTYPIGKNKKGKPIYTSKTVHESADF